MPPHNRPRYLSCAGTQQCMLTMYSIYNVSAAQQAKFCSPYLRFKVQLAHSHIPDYALAEGVLKRSQVL